MHIASKLVLAIALCLPPSMGSFTLRAEETPAAANVLEAIKADAEQGKAYAQVLIAGHFINHKDYASAYFWARKAADQGDPMAETIVGEFYANGNGVAQSHGEARKWLLKAADQHYPIAEHDLAVMYYRGESGAPKDYAESLKWYLRASDHNEVEPNTHFTLG